MSTPTRITNFTAGQLDGIAPALPPHPVVYMCWDATQRLLYVGSSGDLGMRVRKHRQATPWWPDVAHVTVGIFDDLANARDFESQAIFDLRPPHNIRGNPAAAA